MPRQETVPRLVTLDRKIPTPAEMAQLEPIFGRAHSAGLDIRLGQVRQPLCERRC